MRTAVVTGAAGAIGSAVCSLLIGRGFRVVAVDVDADGLARLPDDVSPVVADLTDPDFTSAVREAVERLGGRCDVLVNNAGIVNTTPVDQLRPEQVLREQAINLQAPILLSLALMPALKAAGGQIVSVVSLASMLPLAESPGYCASKAGLRAFMSSLALSENTTGVRISMVHPGAVDTPMLQHEARSGGSALNFLTPPMKPAAVAKAVVGQIDRPKLEVLVPASDGWLVRLAATVPAVLRRSNAVLCRLGERGRNRYLGSLG